MQPDKQDKNKHRLHKFILLFLREIVYDCKDNENTEAIKLQSYKKNKGLQR